MFKVIKLEYLRCALLLVVLSLITSCSSVAPPEGYDFKTPAHKPVREEPSARALSMPWETWPLDVDLHGGEIKNFYMQRGDELVFQGKRDQALSFYQQAVGRTLEPEGREALVLRIASCQLALDQPQAALRTIGQFFKSQGRDESNVDPRFSLVLAYAYGRKQDWDQGLAWFSRAQQISTGSLSIKRAAGMGTSLLLRAVPDAKLEAMESVWQSDPFIYSALNSEKRRRTQQGITVGLGEAKRPFWEFELGKAGGGDSFDVADQVAHEYVIGVLLPLSGKFAALGKNTKNGIELALLSASSGVKIRAVYKDSAGDVETAIREMGSLIETDRVNIIVGPLLADVASAVLPLAAERHIPVVTFSKRTDLQLGDSLFRLGATVESQVASLLNATVETLQLSKVAIVYPENTDGVEYATVFRKKAYELGVEIVYDSSYFQNDPQSLARISAELDQKDVQGIFFPDSVDRAAVFFTTLSPQFREKVRILGPASWDNPTAISNSRSILNGAVFVSPYFQRSTDQLVTQFNDSYSSRFGTKPDFLAAQGFDAATMVLAAFRRQLQEGVPFLESFKAISGYHGLTGEIALGALGEVERQFTVVSLQDGELRPIWPVIGTAIPAKRS